MLFHVFESFSPMSTGEVGDGLVGLVAAALSVSDNYCNIHSSCLCIRVKLMDTDHDCVVVVVIVFTAAITIIGVLGAR
jgi:hypothetical protein